MALHVNIFIVYQKAESAQMIILCIALGRCEIVKVNTPTRIQETFNCFSY